MAWSWNAAQVDGALRRDASFGEPILPIMLQAIHVDLRATGRVHMVL